MTGTAVVTQRMRELSFQDGDKVSCRDSTTTFWVVVDLDLDGPCGLTPRLTAVVVSLEDLDRLRGSTAKFRQLPRLRHLLRLHAEIETAVVALYQGLETAEAAG